jgi:aspartyl-tRNA(Asn)/glutamyl-tRNA(Gln) amidotransferase subunit A
MQVLARHDPDCADSVPAPRELDFTLPARPDIKGLRVGVLEHLSHEPPEPDVARAFDEALDVLRTLGATMQPVTIEDVELARNHTFALIGGEGAHLAGHLLDDPSTVLGDEVRGGLIFGRSMPAERMARAERYRMEITHRVNRAFADVDVMVAPTAPVAPFRFGEAYPKNLITHTPLADLTRMPSLSVPMGFSDAGLPLGLMLMTPAFTDPEVLRIGKAFEQATDWHLRRPAL